MTGTAEPDEVQRFARLRELFHQCCDASAAERDAVLAGLARSDPALAREIKALLEDAAVPVPTPSTGGSVGGFRLLAEIGRGGMGVVWRAERAQNGFVQQVALKRLPAGQHSDSARRRFLREWRILARLEHPAIARLIDAGIDHGQPWLAMELVDGPAYAEQAPTLALRQRIAVLLDVCDAVAYAHARLVLHRDLKPANLRFGADGRVRLLDFGIARLLDETDPELTFSGLPAGTPGYAAPEQWRGETVGTAADVYALGRLLAQAAGGDPLLLAVAARASAEQPEWRYPSAAALAEDLGDWLFGRALRSGVGSRRARLVRWLGQYRWPLGTAVAVTLSLAAGLWLTWQQAERARAESQRARDHLSALLEVIGAASPEVYAGTDPPASAFLAEAGRRLAMQSPADPELQWRSLTQIGQGLLNLGQPDAAIAVLEAALTALERWPHAQQASKYLVTLRLLVLAVDGDRNAVRLERISAQIATAAARPGASAGDAMSALAAAAASWSRMGEFARSRALLDAAAPLLSARDVAPHSLENYWRQRGWSALRERDLDRAGTALHQALAVTTAQAGTFSALRIAELHWLLAEVALQQGAGGVAVAALSKARPAFLAEYPEDHPERGTLALMEARAALLQSNREEAAAHLATATQIWQRTAPQPVEANQLVAVTAAVKAAQGDCAAADQVLRGLVTLSPEQMLPHHSGILAQARAAVDRCWDSHGTAARAPH